MSDAEIAKLPLNSVQTDGFIFIWTINAKYRASFTLMEHWGYQ